jgi:hypothetical protein
MSRFLLSEPSEPCSQFAGEALESEPWNDMTNQGILGKGKLTSMVRVTTTRTATARVLCKLHSFINNKNLRVNLKLYNL